MVLEVDEMPAWSVNEQEEIAPCIYFCTRGTISLSDGAVISSS